MEQPAVVLRDVEFSWDGSTTTLRVPNLTVGLGERIFLQGASGSGKSTLLGLIGGVLTPRTGELALMGARLPVMRAGARDRFRADHIGFVFQMFNLIPYLSVMANVLLPLQFSRQRQDRLGDANANAEALRLLRALGLQDPSLLERPVTQLSIGQQQRVAAARALIGRPPIVIADEPTSALDVDARQDFLDLLMNECAAHGITLLFVSHDGSLGTLFDRTLTMREVNHIGGSAL